MWGWSFWQWLWWPLQWRWQWWWGVPAIMRVHQWQEEPSSGSPGDGPGGGSGSQSSSPPMATASRSKGPQIMQLTMPQNFQEPSSSVAGQIKWLCDPAPAHRPYVWNSSLEEHLSYQLTDLLHCINNLEGCSCMATLLNFILKRLFGMGGEQDLGWGSTMREVKEKLGLYWKTRLPELWNNCYTLLYKLLNWAQEVNSKTLHLTNHTKGVCHKHKK